MNLPDFVVIGEQKCGTGWLMDQLQVHPDVFMYPTEVQFFCKPEIFDRGLEWYSSLFPPAAPGQVRGEKSADYFWFDSGHAEFTQAAHRAIREALPEARVMLSLRNPVDRAVSSVNHWVHHPTRRISPLDARFRSFMDVVSRAPRSLGIIERGFYADRLERCMEVFGRDLLVLVFERDIAADPERCLRNVCAHIGVDPRRATFQPDHNRKERKPSFPAAVLKYHVPRLRRVAKKLDAGKPFTVKASADERRVLVERYRSDVERVERLLGVELPEWKR